jgi:hypothetical protein
MSYRASERRACGVLNDVLASHVLKRTVWPHLRNRRFLSCASASDRNQRSLRHSCRKRALEASVTAFPVVLGHQLLTGPFPRATLSLLSLPNMRSCPLLAFTVLVSRRLEHRHIGGCWTGGA